ncbi:uncharacterized protein LOC116930552 [Daphnia magna]|uniref:uncharacterized protein LOC116930552 n=1 Tax=Daphnia magna TaxID=35525 RepID=UPI001E1BAD50|nr:uncharacterized protein LOC116930552 [Daphnia magna]
MTSSEIFWNLGHNITGHNLFGSRSMGYRLFRAFFGTTPQVCEIVWHMLSTRRPPNSTPHHLLWGLLLLKQYNIESVNAVLVGVTEKTFCIWSLMYIQLIANLPVLDFERRLENAPEGTTTFVSLDGTDFPILEPTEFDPKWFSHKFRGAGLRYEIGLCIRTGNIVWAHGGYPCGEWPDLRLARDAFIHHLGIGEKALADKGYRDNNYFLNPNGNQMKKKILERHETVNKRVKQFYSMKNVFRHVLTLHPSFFRAIVNLTQIMIDNGEPLYEVEQVVE